MFPGLIADHGNSFDVIEMVCIELDVGPERSGLPAMKIDHFKQNANFTVLANQSFHFWKEPFVIGFGK